MPDTVLRLAQMKGYQVARVGPDTIVVVRLGAVAAAPGARRSGLCSQSRRTVWIDGPRRHKSTVRTTCPQGDPIRLRGVGRTAGVPLKRTT